MSGLNHNSKPAVPWSQFWWNSLLLCFKDWPSMLDQRPCQLQNFSAYELSSIKFPVTVHSSPLLQLYCSLIPNFISISSETPRTLTTLHFLRIQVPVWFYLFSTWPRVHGAMPLVIWTSILNASLPSSIPRNLQNPIPYWSSHSSSTRLWIPFLLPPKGLCSYNHVPMLHFYSLFLPNTCMLWSNSLYSKLLL